MYAWAELFCVSRNVSNKFVFRRFTLRGGSSPLSPLRAPLLADNLRTRVQDTHAEDRRDSITRVNKTRHLSVNLSLLRHRPI